MEKKYQKVVPVKGTQQKRKFYTNSNETKKCLINKVIIQLINRNRRNPSNAIERPAVLLMSSPWAVCVRFEFVKLCFLVEFNGDRDCSHNCTYDFPAAPRVASIASSYIFICFPLNQIGIVDFLTFLYCSFKNKKIYLSICCEEKVTLFSHSRWEPLNKNRTNRFGFIFSEFLDKIAFDSINGQGQTCFNRLTIHTAFALVFSIQQSSIFWRCRRWAYWLNRRKLIIKTMD